MSVFDNDQKAMLDVYLYETTSLFEQLDTILMQVEKSKILESQDIHTIFRIMHTTKSSSSMMNLPQIAELMHHVEDLFALLREEPEQLKGHETMTFDLLFDISTFMHQQLSIMKEEDYQPEDTTVFLSRTKDLLEQITNREQIKQPVSEEPTAVGNDLGIYIHLKFEEGSQMENIRAYMIASQIQEFCTTLEYYPHTLENNPDALAFIKKNGFYLHVVADQPQLILERLHRSLFVETCDIIDKNDYLMKLHPETEPTHEQQEPISAQKDTSSVIPVQIHKLDQLQNLTGELMIAESMMIAKLKETGQKELLHTFDKYFHKIFLDMEEIVMSVRLVPISRIVPKLNRVVRDICHKEQKDVSLIVKGDDIEIDKEIVDSLFDPLMHLLRNAVDHGIESKEERLTNHKPAHGEIKLSVENTNGEIVIHIEDDGRGLDLDKIKQKAKEKMLLTRAVETYTKEELLNMTLLPGFSTNKEVNEFSGRGVGLDVVKNMADRFKGHINIESTPGRGTMFSLHLPLTLTIVESMLFHCGPTTFSVPSHNVARFFSYDVESDNIQEENDHYVYLYKNKVLPILHLDQFYHNKPSSSPEKTIIYLKSSTKEACIVVDDVLGNQYIVDKSLPALLNMEFRKHTGISGCSLLGNGEICMTLNVEYLLNSCM